MAKEKVTYTRSSIKQLVKLLDPKPVKDTIYRFSKGRTFTERKPYS